MNIQCGLCSKISLQSVKISKCNHSFCSICILDYLNKRRFCPLCQPCKEKNKKFHFLTFLHPIKLIKKLKKQKNKIKISKHLIAITENQLNNQISNSTQLFSEQSNNEQLNNIQLNNDQSNNIQSNNHQVNNIQLNNQKSNNEQLNIDQNKSKITNYVPLITVEKESINQTNSNKFDLNNNTDLKPEDIEKRIRIKELLIENEKLKIFIDGINFIKDKMTTNKLNELDNSINELINNQNQLRNESNLLMNEVNNLKELSIKLDDLMKTKLKQDKYLEKLLSFNDNYKELIGKFKDENLELKDKYTNLLDNFNKIKILDHCFNNI